MRIHKATFAVVWAMLMFAGWWSGIDYLQRDFMPAFWFISTLTFSLLVSILTAQIKDGSL